MRKPDIGKKKAAIALGAPILALTIYMATGVNYIEAKGTCHTEVRSCHGIPLKNQCIGIESSTIQFQDSNQCSELSEIEQRCHTARNTLCNSTEYSGDEWKETPVKGFSCAEWENQYSNAINLKSCGAN
ncbi:MAG: hypothetical protein ACI83Q_000573 [Colwellia polaris]|jgi:hypothetical protein